MRNVKLVIFDMDGLLFDTEQPSYKAMKQSMEIYGFDFPLDVYKRMIGINDQGSMDIIKEICGTDYPIEQIFKRYDQEFKYILETEGITVKSGAHKLLDWLDKNNYKKCIASSSSRDTIANYLSMAGLVDEFDFYVSGEEVENGKPAPDVFLEACRRANEIPASAIVLEDSIHGLRAATKAGIPCIIIPDLIEINGQMKRDSYCVVSNLKEVIGVLEGRLT